MIFSLKNVSYYLEGENDVLTHGKDAFGKSSWEPLGYDNSNSYLVSLTVTLVSHEFFFKMNQIE